MRLWPSIVLLLHVALWSVACGPHPFELNAHPALLEYKKKIEPPDDLQQQLDAIDMSQTKGADAKALAFIGADRAVRVLLPFALESAQIPDQAAKLRALPPLLDVQAARGALDQKELGLVAALARVLDGAPAGAFGPGLAQQQADMTMRSAAGALALAIDTNNAANDVARQDFARRCMSLVAMTAHNAVMSADLAFVDEMQRQLAAGNFQTKAPGPTVDVVKEASRALLADLVAVARGKDPKTLAPAAQGGTSETATAAETTPAEGETCDKPPADKYNKYAEKAHFMCLLDLARAGKVEQVATMCGKVMTDPDEVLKQMPLGKLEACFKLGPPALLELDKKDDSKKFAAKVCDMRMFGQKEAPDAKQRISRSAAMACGPVLFHGEQAGETKKSQTTRLDAAVGHFAHGCHQDVKEVAKRARELCGDLLIDTPKK